MITTKKDKLRNLFIHILFIVMAIAFLYTFLLVLGSSFESQHAIDLYGYHVVPREFTLEAYKRVFADWMTIVQAYWITFLTTITGVVIGLLLTSLMGYVLSRPDYPYKKIVSFYCFFTMLFNGGLVPTYMLITRTLGLKNTIWAIVLPGCVNVWYMMLMKAYFKSLPTSLIEAAKIDGMGELGIFSKIVIPLSKPAFATIGLFFTLSYWNQWYSSMLYTDERKLVSLQYMLMKILKSLDFLKNQENMALLQVEAYELPTKNVRMAMCVVVAGPILLVFPFFQKYFVQGINVGAVKG